MEIIFHENDFHADFFQFSIVHIFLTAVKLHKLPIGYKMQNKKLLNFQRVKRIKGKLMAMSASNN